MNLKNKKANILFSYILFCTVFVIGCNKAKVPKDFSFRFADNIDEVNSSDSTFKRKFVFRDSLVKIGFTPAEKAEIYKVFLQNKVFDLPDKIYTTGNCIVPYETYYLWVNYNGRHKKTVLYANCNKIGSVANAFLNIRKEIITILQSKPQYIHLPTSNIFDL